MIAYTKNYRNTYKNIQLARFKLIFKKKKHIQVKKNNLIKNNLYATVHMASKIKIHARRYTWKTTGLAGLLTSLAS